MFWFKPNLDISKIKDDFTNSKPGFSFVSYPDNNFSTIYQDLLIQVCTTRGARLPPRPIATASVKGLPKGGRKKIADSEAYRGLFEANLKMQDRPTVWEVCDLRENVTGGEKTWTEKASCLECDVNID
jgi:hypothetical protein